MTNSSVLCELPGNFYWEVTVHPGLDSVHITLCKRRKVVPMQTSECAVLDASRRSVDEWIRLLTDRSYKMWRNYRAKNEDDLKEWRDKTDKLRQALGSDVKVSIRK